jgi:hypothetical protein
MWSQITQGSYTADNNNRIGLYTTDGSNFALVASCANDGNLWKGASSTVVSKAFSSTYAATAGLYFVAALFTYSALVTAPVIASSGVISGGLNTWGLAANIYRNPRIAAQNDLPSAPAVTGMTDNFSTLLFGVY